MVENLKEKAAKGILWKFFGQGGTQIIQFISGIYIARILSPEDYGLVGMMAIFLGISYTFVDSGFRATLIQKGTEVSQTEYSVVFYFNLLVSFIFFLVIFIGAPAISNFYNEPKLIPIARVLGANLILVSLGIIQIVILEKKLNFKTITKVKLIGIFCSVIAGVILATTGFGVWALVAMFLVENFTKTILFWVINKWRPELSFNFNVFKKLFPMGSKILLNGILNQVNQNIYSLIIGKYFTTTDVGFYSQGRKLQQRIGDFITFSIQGVMFPVQSLIKDDIPRLKKSVRKNLNISTLIAFPAITGLIVIAKPFIIIFLTDKWLPSVYYLQVLSIAGLFYVINAALRSYLIPMGKINFLLKYTVGSSIMLGILVGIGILLKIDLRSFVALKIAHEIFNTIVMLITSKKFIEYTLPEFLLDILPGVVFSTLMGGVIYITSFYFEIGLVVLFAQVTLGVCVYILLNYLFNKNTYYELKHFITSEILKLNKTK